MGDNSSPIFSAPAPRFCGAFAVPFVDIVGIVPDVFTPRMQKRGKIAAFDSSAQKKVVDARRKGISFRGTIMRSGELFSLVVLFLAGCMSPVTKRLDTTNEELAITNQHLAAINEKTSGANARMIEMNEHLLATNQQLLETNRRLEAIEKRLPRLPGFGAGEPPVPLPEKGPEVAN